MRPENPRGWHIYGLAETVRHMPHISPTMRPNQISYSPAGLFAISNNVFSVSVDAWIYTYDVFLGEVDTIRCLPPFLLMRSN
jgi:hypothetical protein